MTPGCSREVTWIRRHSLLGRWPYAGWQQMPEAKVTSLLLCPGLLDCVHCFMWHRAKPRFKLCSRDCQNLVFPATFLWMSPSGCPMIKILKQNYVSHPCQQWTEYAKCLSPEKQEGYCSHIIHPVLCVWV